MVSSTGWSPGSRRGGLGGRELNTSTRASSPTTGRRPPEVAFSSSPCLRGTGRADHRGEMGDRRRASSSPGWCAGDRHGARDGLGARKRNSITRSTSPTTGRRPPEVVFSSSPCPHGARRVGLRGETGGALVSACLSGSCLGRSGARGSHGACKRNASSRTTSPTTGRHPPEMAFSSSPCPRGARRAGRRGETGGARVAACLSGS